MIRAGTAAIAAPWWGVPLIAGLFAILGVIAAQVVTWRLDRRRAERDDTARWLRERGQVYAAFLSAALDLHRKIWDTWEGADIRQEDVISHDLVARQGEVHLIASADVRLAANGVLKALEHMGGKANISAGSTNPRIPSSKAFYRAYNQFIDKARRELGAEM